VCALRHVALLLALWLAGVSWGRLAGSHTAAISRHQRLLWRLLLLLLLHCLLRLLLLFGASLGVQVVACAAVDVPMLLLLLLLLVVGAQRRRSAAWLALLQCCEHFLQLLHALAELPGVLL
jgi:uncharacterized protein (TIGR03382 family)